MGVSHAGCTLSVKQEHPGHLEQAPEGEHLLLWHFTSLKQEIVVMYMIMRLATAGSTIMHESTSSPLTLSL